MTRTTTTIWDPAAHLSTADDVAAYFEAALQDGDLRYGMMHRSGSSSTPALQYGMGSNPSDCRTGIFVGGGDISLCNVDSRTHALQLRINPLQQPEGLLHAAEGTLHLRYARYLHFFLKWLAARLAGRNVLILSE